MKTNPNIIKTSSSKSSKNLFEHEHDSTQHSFGSKSAKGTLTSTSSIEQSSTNNVDKTKKFESMDACPVELIKFESRCYQRVHHDLLNIVNSWRLQKRVGFPTPMPSPAAFTTTATLINQQEIPPADNQSSPHLSNAVIIPALSTNPLKTKADKTQDNNDFLNEMDYSGNDDQEQITVTRNYSKNMVTEKNNVFLAYGLVSASAVLTLATVGLIASRRKSVIAENQAIFSPKRI
jgi:hypothetical protein